VLHWSAASGGGGGGGRSVTALVKNARKVHRGRLSVEMNRPREVIVVDTEDDIII
jgi:hypothetical protein